MKKLFTLLAICMMAVTSAWAADAKVCKIGSTEYSSVQDAINAVTAGQTIQLTKDIDLTATISVPSGKTVTLDLNGHVLNAGTIPAPTNVGDYASVIYNQGTLNIIDSNPTAAHTQTGLTDIKGGVLTGGKGDNHSSNTYGGAIENLGTLSIKGGTITGNTATLGGGIYNFEGTCTLEGGTITENTATKYGAGINNDGGNCTLTGVTVKENVSDVQAGGIMTDGGTLTLDGCTVTNNTSVGNYPSGGVYCWVEDESTVTLKGKNIIKDNTTTYGGTTFAANLCLSGWTAPQQVTINNNGIAGSEIGISTMVYDVVAAAKFTTNGSATDAAYFTSDNSDYKVSYNTGGKYLELVEQVAHNYLCFTAQEANSSVTFKWWLGSDVMYSTDGTTFTAYTKGTKITLAKAGDKVYFKGKDINTTGSDHFIMTGKIAASGDVTSLTNETGGDATLTISCYYSMFSGCTSLTAAPNLPAKTLADNCYSSMFYGCTSLTTAPALPATTLAGYCYRSMFHGCTSLTTAPELPATTLANSCYSSLFSGCTSLTTAPALPATTLANSCYSSMFSSCTSLTTAPALPATTLAEECYYSMFKNCTSLTTAPELPATTLADYCYYSMFSGCTSLTAAPALPATTLAITCYTSMFSGCTSLTTAPELPATTLANSCYSFMFDGCTSLTAAPELPATTLANYCYYDMFDGCTSLTAAPALPATTLANYCYYDMFYGCTALNSVTANFTDWNTSGKATTDWLKDVAATGTFNCPAELDVTARDASHVPEGWTTSNDHKWATEWTTDENAHWHECTDEGCEEIKDYGTHGYGSDKMDKSYYICSTCGYENATRKAEHEEALEAAWLASMIKDIVEKIDAIGTVKYTPECKARIDAARAAINQLGLYERTLVPNRQKLYDAEAEYARLEKIATGINDVNADADANKNGKYLENGKVVIYRNGRKYTSAGTQIR